jgi:hypothetical protein
VKDHSILDALSASLDDQEDTHVPASSLYDAKHDEAQHFSAVYEGKARRIAKITDTRIHQHMEQGWVEWMDGSTAWIGIQDFSSAAQEHVRVRLHGELEMEEGEDSEGCSESKRRKRRRKEIPSQNTANKAKEKRRNKRHKNKEAEELDAKISMSL